MKAPVPKAQTGFTLVEMLVALAALALLTALAGSLGLSSLNSRERLAAVQVDVAEQLRLWSLLKADLNQAAGRRVRDQAGNKRSGALFAASVSDRADAGGDAGVFLEVVRRGWENSTEASRSSLQAVRYRLVAGRIERQNRPFVDRSEWGPPITLFEDIEAVEVSFFDRDQWVENWTGAPNRPLPMAVKLKIKRSETDILTASFRVPEGRP
jgi:general secretion pathway protein J